MDDFETYIDGNIFKSKQHNYARKWKKHMHVHIHVRLKLNHA